MPTGSSFGKRQLTELGLQIQLKRAVLSFVGVLFAGHQRELLSRRNNITQMQLQITQSSKSTRKIKGSVSVKVSLFTFYNVITSSSTNK